MSADVEIAAVHIGMLASARVARAVAEFLGRRGKKGRATNIVLDPVLRSSSGAELLDVPGVKFLVEKLIPLADVVTPNVDEAADRGADQEHNGEVEEDHLPPGAECG